MGGCATPDEWVDYSIAKSMIDTLNRHNLMKSIETLGRHSSMTNVLGV